MTGEELEVRSRALTYLFDVLMKYGQYFDFEFWKIICENLLFPIFHVLSNHWEIDLMILMTNYQFGYPRL